MNILTFDIEDWYNHDDYSQNFNWDEFEVRLYDGVDKILAALDQRKIHASFMCLGWIAEKHPQIIRNIYTRGHHIGCHSYQHQLATRFTPTQFEEDTYKAKCLLEDLCGCAIDTYRIPSFSVTTENLWVFDILAKMGFKYDCSVFPDTHEFGGIPCFPATPTIIKTAYGPLKEFPISSGRIFGRKIIYSGGGYFRIIPYPFLKKLTTESKYVMSYFHPSDFDPKQPSMPQLTYMRQFKNRIALNGAYDKFKRYITDFDFSDIPTADHEIVWDSIIKLSDIKKL